MNKTYLKQIIEKAMKEDKWLKIDYVSKKMEITTRVIDPIQFGKNKKTGEPTIIADCLLRRAVRPFEFEGIKKIETIEKGSAND